MDSQFQQQKYSMKWSSFTWVIEYYQDTESIVTEFDCDWSYLSLGTYSFDYLIRFEMEITKQLGTLVEQATSDSHTETPFHLYEKILTLINSRVDMPKHTLNAVSKRLSIKNKKVLFYCYDLLQYLSFHCELSLYTQISTKQFLLKTSGLLMNQDIDNDVQTKVLQTVKCWEELFRPYEDLLPMYFQFYAGLLRKDFPIQKDYVSPHRPKDFKVQRQKQEQQKKQEEYRARPSKEKAVEPTKNQQQTFETIREKIILTNEIIDNANPAEGVKSSPLLVEMMQQIKASEKKINQTINENPNEKIMELALAANDDIYITYRRFKDLQKNRKPEPFILTELASDATREKEIKEQKKIQESIKKKQSSRDQFDNFNKSPQSKKIEEKPKQSAVIDIMDLACEPVQNKQEIKSDPMDLISLAENTSVPSQKPVVDLFDLLGGPNVAPQPQPLNFSLSPSNAFMENNYLGPSSQFSNQNNFNSGVNNITLNQPNPNIDFSSNFTTDNDLKKYDDRSVLQKITDLSEELRDIRKES